MKTGLERIGMILLAVIITAVILFFRGADTAPEQPADVAAAAQSANIPQSVMNYSGCPFGTDDHGVCLPDPTIPCYTGDQYDLFLKEQHPSHRLAATALLDNNENLEIYMAPDSGDFLAAVTGPDQSGREETCIVSSGTGLEWHIIDDRQFIFVADPSSLPAPESAPATTPEPPQAAETPPAP